MDKPYSQACENNKSAILSVLRPHLAQYSQVLEIGSGTGQHAIHFARALPHLQWQTSDRPINHAGIQAWIDEAQLTNVCSPLLLDLNAPWPIAQVPVIYSANTMHIVSKKLVEAFFSGVKTHLANEGLLCVYGPFNYQGRFTSESNAQFDAFLKRQDSLSGIRDFEWICDLASKADLSLLFDNEMPANNRLLLFKRQ